MLGKQVPQTVNFDVGYYEGQQHSEVWLFSDSDLQAMYEKHTTGDITLGCDGRSDEEGSGHSRHKRNDSFAGSSEQQKREDEVDSVFWN